MMVLLAAIKHQTKRRGERSHEDTTEGQCIGQPGALDSGQ